MLLLDRGRRACAPGHRDPTRAPRLAPWAAPGPLAGRRAPSVGVALGAGTAVLVAVVAALAPRRVEVTGWSMGPGLRPGDRLLVLGRLPARPGAVVVAADPRRPSRRIVKRVVSVGPSGIVLAGDDPARSTDSRHFGPVPPRLVEGRAAWRYAPPERAGRLPGPPPGWPGGHG